MASHESVEGLVVSRHSRGGLGEMNQLTSFNIGAIAEDHLGQKLLEVFFHSSLGVSVI